MNHALYAIAPAPDAGPTAQRYMVQCHHGRTSIIATATGTKEIAVLEELLTRHDAAYQPLVSRSSAHGKDAATAAGACLTTRRAMRNRAERPGDRASRATGHPEALRRPQGNLNSHLREPERSLSAR